METMLSSADEFIELSSLLVDIFPDRNHDLEFSSDAQHGLAFSPPTACAPPSVVSVEETNEVSTMDDHHLGLSAESSIKKPAIPVSSRKRRRSAPVEGMSAKDATSRQKNNRRERNREHAKRSRSKKKSFTQSLEAAAVSLRTENAKLKDLVQDTYGAEKTAEMIRQRIATPTDRFVQALSDPSGRVLSMSAISYLRSLSKECQR